MAGPGRRWVFWLNVPLVAAAPAAALYLAAAAACLRLSGARRLSARPGQPA